MLKLHKKQLFVACSLILATALIIGSVAWFANRWGSGGTIPFRPAGNPDMPVFDAWMFLDEEEIDDDSMARWVRQTTSADETVGGYQIPAVVASTSADTNGNTVYTYTASELHCGKVDNLVSLKKDNIIYWRLTVDPAKTGRQAVRMKFDYKDSSTADAIYNCITLYNHNGNLVTVDDLKQKITINDPNDETLDQTFSWFLQFAYCVTDYDVTNPLDESGTYPEGCLAPEAFDALSFSEFSPIRSEIEVDISDKNYATPYYIYIMVAPRLDVFIQQENLLDSFVPSYMLFETKFEVEIH